MRERAASSGVEGGLAIPSLDALAARHVVCGIVLRPRSTLRAILDDDPDARLALVIVGANWILGIVVALAQGTVRAALPIALFSAPLAAIAALPQWLLLTGLATLLRGAGRLMGGRADMRSLRSALAWAALRASLVSPVMLAAAIVVVEVTRAAGWHHQPLGTAVPILFGWSLAFAGLAIAVSHVGVAQRFGTWKSARCLFIVLAGSVAVALGVSFLLGGRR